MGSASYITNLDGEVVQHIEYVPFGEVFIEERNNTWNTPYLFNGKELDEETGLYYYHNRYYNPRTSLWLSTDPLFDKYPAHSPYCYTMNNPVMLIDPDGMRVDDPPVGHENNPVLLGEATVVGKAPSGFSSEGKYGTWTSSFDGTLADWNKQNGNIGDNHEEAMDEYQRQVSAIDNRAVKQSVNNAINEDATTVAGVSVGLPVAIIGGAELAAAGLINLPAMGGEFTSQLIKHDFNGQDAVMNFNITSAIPGGNIWGKGLNVVAGTFVENSNLNKGFTFHTDGIDGHVARGIVGSYVQYTGTQFGKSLGNGVGNSYGNYINILTTYGQKNTHANVK